MEKVVPLLLLLVSALFCGKSYNANVGVKCTCGMGPHRTPPTSPITLAPTDANHLSQPKPTLSGTFQNCPKITIVAMFNEKSMASDANFHKLALGYFDA